MYRLSPYTYIIESLLGQGIVASHEIISVIERFSSSHRETEHQLRIR